LAQGQIGAAAVGATAEDPKMFGKGMILMVLPETIVILGFVVAFLLYGKV
jgi:V/A-type H+-transporting ATPase subunit K